MGGSNHPSNLIELNIEEHANAHKELFEKYGCWQDEIAYKALSGQITNAEANLEKCRLSKLGKNNPRYGKPGTLLGKKGSEHPAFGKKTFGRKGRIQSDETKQKIRDKLTGVKHSQERIEKNRQGQMKLINKGKSWKIDQESGKRVWVEKEIL
jgi:hypothetical protein